MDSLAKLAVLFKQRNAIDEQIAALIGRPTQTGHIGEYIAAAIFNIKLHPSATHNSSDGIFMSGSLKGRNVDVKFYPKHESLLDLNVNNPADYYLVLTGLKGAAVTSRGAVRPLAIESVFLFDGHNIVQMIRQSGRKVGVATSVRQELWNAAEIYPHWNNQLLPLTNEQKAQLALFRLGA